MVDGRLNPLCMDRVHCPHCHAPHNGHSTLVTTEDKPNREEVLVTRVREAKLSRTMRSGAVQCTQTA